MSQLSRSGFAMVRNALAVGAVASGALLISGVGQAAARSDGGLSVASISVVVGSGAHTETVTVRSGSSAIGAQYPLVIFSASANFLSGPVPSSSTHATCAQGAPGFFRNEGYAWTCTPSGAGWGAGTIGVSVDITESALQAVSPGCLNGGCTIPMTAQWEAPLGGAQGAIAIVPGAGSGTMPSPGPSATKAVTATPSVARTSAQPSPSSASASATASASSTATASAAVLPAASDSPSATASTANATATHSAALDAAPTGGSGDPGSSQLWALLAALCIVAAGVTSAVMAGKGRHRA